MAALLFYAASAARSNILETSAQIAQDTIGQYNSLRRYYTENVAGKIAGRAGLTISHTYRDDRNAIPLPATMMHDLSELQSQSKDGLRINLYSAYPFPHRTGRVLDEFQRAALAAFERNPDTPFVREGVLEGRRVVRVAIADRMVAAACVECHNSHALSPKKDWKLREVRGSLEVAAPVERSLASVDRMMAGVAVIGLAGAALSGGFLAWFLARVLTRPVRLLTAQLSESADCSAEASNQVSQAVMSLAQGATEQAAAVEETSASMVEMNSVAGRNTENTEATIQLIDGVHRDIGKTNQALEEMRASMSDLRASGHRIGKIIKTVDEIAFQTNLLALNAAVEAARAGEAGQGFAVVADEVRRLAQRAAEAARETTGLIEDSVTRTAHGSERLERVDSAVRGITGALERVKKMVDEVGAGSRDQTAGLGEVGHALTQMESVTQRTAAAAEECAAAGADLNRRAQDNRTLAVALRELVEGRVE
ncbi:MAG: DUF3365 domain-containing protein [Acidobacteria bacterium]|nr:DUF3365 domain-containing protein [Acidobacteriota bacterium]